MRSNQAAVVPRDFGTMLLDGVYVIPAEPQSTTSWLLYAPVIDRIFRLRDSQAALLFDNLHRQDTLRKLLKSLVGKDVPLPSKPEQLENYKPCSVALMMTTACQLRCTYCYAEAGTTPTANLSRKVAIEAVNYICRNAVDLGRSSVTVHFHGAGEPTLMWKLIFDCLEHARDVAGRHSLTLKTVLTTNLCIPPELAVRFAEEIDTLLVSCDGTPDVMDANRPMLRGSSGQTIDRALRAVVAAGHANKVFVRATITRETQNKLFEFIKYFSDVGIKNVYLVPVSSSGRGISHASVDPATFMSSWRMARHLADNCGIKLESPVADIDRLKPGGFSCGINGSNFAIMPDGRISLCYEAVLPESDQDKFFRIGAVDTLRNKFIVDLKKVNNIREDFHVSQRSVCDGCFAKMSCGGRCAAREIATEDKPRNAEMSVGCDITRTLTFDGIIRRLTETLGDNDERQQA